MKILLIDDDSILLERYVSIASKLDSKPEVYGLSNSSLARDWIERDGFDAIITDMQMPVVNGLDIISLIAEKEIKISCLLHSYGRFYIYKGNKVSLSLLPKKYPFLTFHMKEDKREDTAAYFTSFIAKILPVQ